MQRQLNSCYRHGQLEKSAVLAMFNRGNLACQVAEYYMVQISRLAVDPLVTLGRHRLKFGKKGNREKVFVFHNLPIWTVVQEFFILHGKRTFNCAH